MPQLLKKMAPRTVVQALGLLAIKAPEAEGERRLLYTVVGIAQAYKTGDSSFGPYVAFRGQFRATNPDSKDFIMSGTCFLPQPAQDLIQSALDGMEADEKKGVQFAFDIGIIRAEKSATKYEYTVENLIEPEPQSDPLTLLSQQLPTDRQLPAPKRRGKKDE